MSEHGASQGCPRRSTQPWLSHKSAQGKEAIGLTQGPRKKPKGLTHRKRASRRAAAARRSAAAAKARRALRLLAAQSCQCIISRRVRVSARRSIACRRRPPPPAATAAARAHRCMARWISHHLDRVATCTRPDRPQSLQHCNLITHHAHSRITDRVTDKPNLCNTAA